MGWGGARCGAVGWGGGGVVVVVGMVGWAVAVMVVVVVGSCLGLVWAKPGSGQVGSGSAAWP